MLGAKEGAAAIGSDTLPTEPGLNSCPARPGGYPGSLVDAQLSAGLAFVLSFCNLDLGPDSQCEAALKGLARCRALGRGLPCPWDARIPRVKAVIAVWRDKPVCKGYSGSPGQVAPLYLVSRKLSQERQSQFPPSSMLSQEQGTLAATGAHK